MSIIKIYSLYKHLYNGSSNKVNSLNILKKNIKTKSKQVLLMQRWHWIYTNRTYNFSYLYNNDDRLLQAINILNWGSLFNWQHIFMKRPIRVFYSGIVFYVKLCGSSFYPHSHIHMINLSGKIYLYKSNYASLMSSMHPATFYILFLISQILPHFLSFNIDITHVLQFYSS